MHALRTWVSGLRYLALRTWVSEPQREVSGPSSQDLGFRPSTRGFKTWISGPGFQALNARFQDLALKTWVSGSQREVSGPGSQDLGFRPSMRGFRTWLSGPGFQALGIWLSRPGFQNLESSPSYGRLIFFPSLFLCVQWSQTDERTDYVNLYIRLFGLPI